MDQTTFRTAGAVDVFSDAAADFVHRYWNDGDPVPKHLKLKNAIVGAIEDGYWRPGSRLPTEQSFVAATPCSLGTVQRALRALVADGLIQRRQGSGTVVAGIGAELDEPWHIRVRDSAGDGTGFLPIFTRLIRRRSLSGKGPWTVPLGQADEPVLRIDRIFSVDRRHDVYAIFYAIADRFPELRDLPKEALNGQNFKRMIAQRYRMPTHRIEQRIELVVPPNFVCRQSDCEPGKSCMKLTVTAHSLSGEPIYYQKFYVPDLGAPLELGTASRS